MLRQAILITFIATLTAIIGQPSPAPRLREDAENSPTNRTVVLPTMVVTATRIPEPSSSLPYSVSTVSSSDLQRLLIRTTPDALRELPSVMLQKTSHGQASPYIRGFTGFRTLMLIDGIRLNNSTFRDGPNQYWSTIDPLSVDHLEVVRGPASSLYGSDAVGGTVNALSKGGLGLDPGFHWNASASYRHASAEQSHIAHPEFSASQDDRIGLHAGASFKDFGNIYGGRKVGLQPNTGYGEWDFDAKAEYRLSNHSRLIYAHQTVRQTDVPRTHSTIYGIEWEGTTHGSDLKRTFDQARDLDYLQLHAEDLRASSTWLDALHLSISLHSQTEAQDRIRRNLNRTIQNMDVNTLGLSLQLESQSNFGDWVYGTDYYRDWVASSHHGYNASGQLVSTRLQGPVGDDSNYDLLGAFAENQLPLVQDHLTLTLGGRYTYAAAHARKVQDPYTGAPLSISDSWSNASGNARLLFHPDETKHWSFFGAAAQGFRAPNLSDLTRFDIARSGEQEVPVQTLQPEKYLSLEAGVRWSHQRFNAEAAYFHTFIDDMIVRVPTGEMTPEGSHVVDKQNSGEGWIHGAEIQASYTVFDGWSLWGNASWMRGELNTPIVAGGPETSEPLSRLMPSTVNSGIRWMESRGKFWAEFATTFAERQDRLAPNDKLDTQRIPPAGTPGYGIFHLRAGWNPCANASISAAIENLTNKDYRIHGSGSNEPGRNFILMAELRY